MTMGGVLHLPVFRLLQAVNYLLTMELALAVLTLALLSQETTMVSICDRIWENPPYGIRARFAQCAFLVAQV